MEGALSFPLEVLILEAEGIKSVPKNRLIYCTMEVEREGKLQTEHVEATEPKWNTQGDYNLTHPLPVVKLKLYMENAGMLALEDKELGKLVLRPTLSSCQYAEWHPMVVAKNSPDRGLRLKVCCKMEISTSIKHFGELYAIGKMRWKKWKKRYFVLYEVADKMFVLSSYKLKKPTDAPESIIIDGYTVDYTEYDKAQLMVGTSLKGGNHFFSAVREGDNIVMATDEEKECKSWVLALYKATGQANKPVQPGTAPKTSLTPAQVRAINKAFAESLKEQERQRIAHTMVDPMAPYTIDQNATPTKYYGRRL